MSYKGRGRNGIGNESPGPHTNRLLVKNGIGNESPGPHTNRLLVKNGIGNESHESRFGLAVRR